MNGYAISFDMDIEALRQYYGEPYNPAYADIRSVMLSCGFYWIQGSVYVTPGHVVLWLPPQERSVQRKETEEVLRL